MEQADGALYTTSWDTTQGSVSPGSVSIKAERRSVRRQVSALGGRACII